MAVLIGQTDTGADSANSNIAGNAFATRLVCIESGLIESVWLRCGATIPTAGNTHWAIYADDAGAGAPGARLTADFSGSVGTADTDSGFPVSPGLAVVVGTFYYIAFLSSSGNFDYTDFATSGGDSSDDTPGGGTLPDPWGTESGAFTNIINMRAEGTPDSPSGTPVIEYDYHRYPKNQLRRGDVL